MTTFSAEVMAISFIAIMFIVLAYTSGQVLDNK